MELNEFYNELRAEIISTYNSKKNSIESTFPYEEEIFTEIVLRHMAECGLCPEEYSFCFFDKKIGRSSVKINAYALTQDDNPELFLFITDYKTSENIETFSAQDVRTRAAQCYSFLEESRKGSFDGLLSSIDPVCDIYLTVKNLYDSLDAIHIFVLTNGMLANGNKEFGNTEVCNKKIKMSLMDVERLFHHVYSGSPRDEIVINFEKHNCRNLPCIYVPAKSEVGYDYALTAIPGHVLYYLYEKYSTRLLEENVRSFLQITGKVNKGISLTLRKEPEKFMAYNNGLVIVADDVVIERDHEFGVTIKSLTGFQIVNGGQTTASIYFTKRKYKNETDLEKVRIPAKIIIIGKESKQEETNKLFSDISLYANSQNVVKQSDLSSNNQFHKKLEKIIASLYCDDGMTKWFYERTTGSYNEKMRREGSTPAKLKEFKKYLPSSHKILKTDLATYINCWDLMPCTVAMGTQKNYLAFIERIKILENEKNFEPDVMWAKESIAKAIIYKAAYAEVRRLDSMSAKSVTIFLIAVVSMKLSSKIDLLKIWKNQKLSYDFCSLLYKWGEIVNNIMVEESKGILFTEYAKKPICWEKVKSGTYPTFHNILEIRE